MKVHKTISRFATAPEDPAELRRVARALGDELPRQRLDVLRSARAELARTCLPEQSFAAGYVAGLLDVAAEYESHMRAEADREAQAALAARESVRRVLVELRMGAELPAELAARLGREPAAIAELLDELAAAGLVHAYAGEAGERHMRPYRLTLAGRRILDELVPGISAQVEAGIRVAVSMFHYLCRHDSSPASALQEIAEEVLHAPEAAAAAVRVWAEAAQEADLVTELDLPHQPAHGHEHYYATSMRTAPADARSDRLWRHVPLLLAQLEARRPARVPVYVRTNSSGWGAWAYALQSQDQTGMSRTILDGDLLMRAISPPDQRFDLVYDNREALEADRHEPTMQAFLERADEKFMVAAADDDVPDGFQRLAPGADDAGSN